MSNVKTRRIFQPYFCPYSSTKAPLTQHISPVFLGMSINAPRPAAASTVDVATSWMLQPQYPVLSSILMHKTQQPDWQGCAPCSCPSFLTGDEAGTYFWRCATLPPGLLGPRRDPEGHFCWMPYTEVGMCSQGMEKRGGKGACPDTTLAPLCSPCRGEQLICTQIPAAQHLPPHPHLPAFPPLQKPQICLQQEPSRAAHGARWGKERGFSYKIPLQVL